ncbi:MAG: hypothetical protein AB7P50_12150 [Alphaproteobacteria bacterium]
MVDQRPDSTALGVPLRARHRTAFETKVHVIVVSPTEAAVGNRRRRSIFFSCRHCLAAVPPMAGAVDPAVSASKSSANLPIQARTQSRPAAPRA